MQSLRVGRRRERQKKVGEKYPRGTLRHSLRHFCPATHPQVPQSYLEVTFLPNSPPTATTVTAFPLLLLFLYSSCTRDLLQTVQSLCSFTRIHHALPSYPLSAFCCLLHFPSHILRLSGPGFHRKTPSTRAHNLSAGSAIFLGVRLVKFHSRAHRYPHPFMFRGICFPSGESASEPRLSSGLFIIGDLLTSEIVPVRRRVTIHHPIPSRKFNLFSTHAR